MQPSNFIQHGDNTKQVRDNTLQIKGEQTETKIKICIKPAIGDVLWFWLS